MEIKICCIQNFQEAQLAIMHGATALGLVAEMPSGPGVISEDTIRKIAKSTPRNIDTFLLTSRRNTKNIIAQLKYCKTNTVQIVDSLKIGSYDDIRRSLPKVKIVQVIHVVDSSALLEAKEIAPKVDAILLDSGNPKKKVKELGGTGRTHNWKISKELCSKINVPVYLAGGLNPENVEKAIRSVHPYGLDICSGVRVNGNLDETKLKRYIKNIKNVL